MRSLVVWIGVASVLLVGLVGFGRVSAQSTSRTVVVTGEDAEALQSVNPSDDGRYAGLSMRQRQLAESEDYNFQSNIDYYQQSCGAPIAARIEWRSFAHELDRSIDGEDSHSFRLFCAYALDELAAICNRSDADRRAVVSRIDAYTCVFTGPGRRTLGLEGRQVVVGVDWDAPNYSEYSTDYFGRVL